MVGFERGIVYFWGMPNCMAPAISCALIINEEHFQALNDNYSS
jgi:hypothetical protein